MKNILIFGVLLLVAVLMLGCTGTTPTEEDNTTYTNDTIQDIFPTREKGLPTEYEIINEENVKNFDDSTFELCYGERYIKNEQKMHMTLCLPKEDISVKDYFNTQKEKKLEEGGFTELKNLPSNCFGFTQDFDGLVEAVKIICYKSNSFVYVSGDTIYSLDSNAVIQLLRYSDVIK